MFAQARPRVFSGGTIENGPTCLKFGGCRLDSGWRPQSLGDISLSWFSSTPWQGPEERPWPTSVVWGNVCCETANFRPSLTFSHLAFSYCGQCFIKKQLPTRRQVNNLMAIIFILGLPHWQCLLFPKGCLCRNFLGFRLWLLFRCFVFAKSRKTQRATPWRCQQIRT